MAIPVPVAKLGIPSRGDQKCSKLKAEDLVDERMTETSKEKKFSNNRNVRIKSMSGGWIRSVRDTQ